MKEIKCKISGRVQMVMFRDFTQRKARGLGLTGWVRNCDDSTVEVLAQGEEAPLKEFINLLWRGPIMARVRDVQVSWQEPQESFDAFTIAY